MITLLSVLPYVTGGNAHNHVGGDGAQIDHTGLSNIGTNAHSVLDTHLAASSNPHGQLLSQEYLRITSRMYTERGTIVNNSATTIKSFSAADNGKMYILTVTGVHNDYSSAFFGYGAWVVTRVYNDYTDTWLNKVLPLFSEAYSSQVNVAFSSDDLQITSGIAATGDMATYWSLLKIG